MIIFSKKKNKAVNTAIQGIFYFHFLFLFLFFLFILIFIFYFYFYFFKIGSAADIIKRATISIHEKIQNEPSFFGVKLVLQLHDELVKKK